ncbi:MAG: hypothetical protein ACOYMG_00860 [Candidatus Methylumidiphilus sp.]
MTGKTLELIEILEQMMKSATILLDEAKSQIWHDHNCSLSTKERLWLLEQRADNDHDGLPFSDTLDGA